MTGPAPFELEFRLVVRDTPEEFRRRVVASVVGEDARETPDLEVLDRGPDRFASRFRSGAVEQLRVVEWSGVREAHGAVEHSIGGHLRLSARYALSVVPASGAMALQARYLLTTPHLGLAYSFRWGRRRVLARRLIGRWVPTADRAAWRSLEIHRSGSSRAESERPVGPIG